jgi:DNA-binding PadR family transcriptional regulator
VLTGVCHARRVDRRPSLSLNEWAVLGVLVQRPRHGYDIAAALRGSAPIGAAWRVERQFVYRALERLEALGFVEPRRTEPSGSGPPRTVYGPTRRGRAALRVWLAEPVAHLREVRSALLLKLVLLRELGLPHDELAATQRTAFAPLLAEHAAAGAAGDVVAAWRRESAAAVAAFLDGLEQP